MPTHSDETLTNDAEHPLVVRVHDNDFQCEVLEKLARLEAKMDMLVAAVSRGGCQLPKRKSKSSCATTFAAAFTTSW
jgi:hypothetical protein